MGQAVNLTVPPYKAKEKVKRIKSKNNENKMFPTMRLFIKFYFIFFALKMNKICLFKS